MIWDHVLGAKSQKLLLTKQCHTISRPPVRQMWLTMWLMPQVPPRARITKTGLSRPWPVAKKEFKTPPWCATVLSGLKNGAGILVWWVGMLDSAPKLWVKWTGWNYKNNTYFYCRFMKCCILHIVHLKKIILDPKLIIWGLVTCYKISVQFMIQP